MKIISHRVNTSKMLANLDPKHGAEIDLRYHNKDIVIHHDPFHLGKPETLEAYLSNFHHNGTLILNLKTEGIEEQCIKLMKKFDIKSWFFLDMSQPFLVNFAYHHNQYDINKDNLAVRFSDYEPIEYAISFAKKVGWVWVDRFKTNCLTKDSFEILKSFDFKLCLVSPELQGAPLEAVVEYKDYVSDFKIDAVCTKYPKLWKEE